MHAYRGSGCLFKTRLRLKMQLDYFQPAQTVRNMPHEFVANAVAKHCSAKRREDRNLSVVDVRVSRQHDREFHAFTGFKIKEFGASIDCDDIGWDLFGSHDSRALKFVLQQPQLPFYSRARPCQ